MQTVFLVLTTLTVGAPVVHADSDDATWSQESFEKELAQRAEKVSLIQNRKFELRHEVTLGVGALPADPYFKGLTVGAGYTWNFSPSFAWEVANFTYSFDFSSHIKQQVLAHAILTPGQPPSFPQITWFAATHIVVKPIYGKQALFNTRVVHLEAYLLLGPAVVNQTGPNDRFAVGLDGGVGLRLHLTQLTSFRLDAGDLLYVAPHSAKNALRFCAYVAFNLGTEP